MAMQPQSSAEGGQAGNGGGGREQHGDAFDGR
jgi:hypothetical protein